MANDNIAVDVDGLAIRPIELSFPLPKAPEMSIHLHLRISTTSVLLLMTTVQDGDTSTAAPLGSFVYALPDVWTVWYIYAVESRAYLLSENERGTNIVDTTLHLRVICGVRLSTCKTASKKNWEAGLCWQLHKLCKCRNGWHG